MKLSSKLTVEQQIREHGRVIARGMDDVKVGKEKSMIKAAKRRDTMLKNAAEIGLAGGVISSRNK